MRSPARSSGRARRLCQNHDFRSIRDSISTSSQNLCFQKRPLLPRAIRRQNSSGFIFAVRAYTVCVIAPSKRHARPLLRLRDRVLAIPDACFCLTCLLTCLLTALGLLPWAYRPGLTCTGCLPTMPILAARVRTCSRLGGGRTGDARRDACRPSSPHSVTHRRSFCGETR